MEKETAVKRVCGWDEEVFVLAGESDMVHLLPGEEVLLHPETEERLLSFARRQKIWLPAGTGNLTDNRGNKWGGYCMVLCGLICARRFVIKNKDSLWQGAPPEEILSEILRRELTGSMRESVFQPEWNGSEKDKQTLWTVFEAKLEEALWKSGWTAEEIRPGLISRQREGA